MLDPKLGGRKLPRAVAARRQKQLLNLQENGGVDDGGMHGLAQAPPHSQAQVTWIFGDDSDLVARVRRPSYGASASLHPSSKLAGVHVRRDRQLEKVPEERGIVAWGKMPADLLAAE